MLKSIYKWVRSIILWLLIKENREIGLKNTKMVLDALSVLSLSTKTDRDNKAPAMLSEKVSNALKNTSNEGLVQDALYKISQEKFGALKDLNIGYVDNKIKTSFGAFGAEYDPSDGGISFKVGIKK